MLASSRRELEEEKELLERGKREAATEADKLDLRREVYTVCPTGCACVCTRYVTSIHIRFMYFRDNMSGPLFDSQWYLGTPGKSGRPYQSRQKCEFCSCFDFFNPPLVFACPFAGRYMLHALAPLFLLASFAPLLLLRLFRVLRPSLPACILSYFD